MLNLRVRLRMSLARYAVLALPLVSAGCTTHLLSVPEAEVTADSRLAGLPYTLPMLQYHIRVVRSLDQCEDQDKNTDVKLKVVAEAKPEFVAGEAHTIYYPALASWSKISSLDLETYENGTLKTVNAAAEDRGPAIATEVVKTGFAIARLAAGVPCRARDAPATRLAAESQHPQECG